MAAACFQPWKTVHSHAFRTPDEYREAFKGSDEKHPRTCIHPITRPLINTISYEGLSREIHLARVCLKDLEFTEMAEDYFKVRRKIKRTLGISLLPMILALDICHLCNEDIDGDRLIVATEEPIKSVHGLAVLAIQREGKSVWLQSYPVTSCGVLTPKSQIIVELRQS